MGMQMLANVVQESYRFEHPQKFVMKNANSAGDRDGLYVEMTKQGSAAFVSAMRILAKTTSPVVAGGLYGLMCTAQNSSTGAQTGANIMEAAEFNCIIDSTVTNHQEAYCMCLKMTNNSNKNGVAAYMRIRDAGSSMADYFFIAPNWVAGTDAAGAELFTTNTDATPSHGLSVLIGGVRYWFLMTDVHA